jgi:hypothetical protein
MKRCLVVIGICFFATICLGQGQSRYHNSNHHFSFMLPEGWEYIPVGELSSEEIKTLKNPFKLSKTVALCQKIGAEHFTTPYIVVRFRSSEEMPEAAIETVFLEHKEITVRNLEVMIGLLQNAEGCLPKFWEGAERKEAEVEYDKDRHISFETAKLYHKSVGEIVVVTVKVLGSHRMVTLRCYADGEDVENFLDLVNRVVDSFSYDKGYGFGEGKGIAPGLAQKLLGNTWQSWLLWAVGVIIVSWLIRRWVTS